MPTSLPCPRCGAAAALVRPWNDLHRVIAHERSQQPELFLVGEWDASAGEMVATGSISCCKLGFAQVEIPSRGARQNPDIPTHG